jgi:hypothetical protein
LINCLVSVTAKYFLVKARPRPNLGDDAMIAIMPCRLEIRDPTIAAAAQRQRPAAERRDPEVQ